MKRRLTVVGVALVWAATSAAQVRGVPASVTSPTGGRVVLTPSGIPAGVASLGPRGFTREGFGRDFIPATPIHRDRLGRVVLPVPVPLFYEYPVVYVPVQEAARVEVQRRPASEPQKIIVEIRDTRPTSPLPAKETVVEKTAPPRVEAELPRIAAVFIFQDGSRKELKDYAITTTELIDLSDGLIKRSPLASLDRAATLRANAEKGVEVHFPAAASD